VVVAVGSVPAVSWLRGAKLPLDDGVLCGPTCHVVGSETIVAAGDVARWPNLRFDPAPQRVQHWLNAVEMSRAAAENLLAGPQGSLAFTPVPRYWSEQHGVRIQVAGQPMLGTDTVLLESPVAGTRPITGFVRNGTSSASSAWTARRRPPLDGRTRPPAPGYPFQRNGARPCPGPGRSSSSPSRSPPRAQQCCGRVLRHHTRWRSRPEPSSRPRRHSRSPRHPSSGHPRRPAHRRAPATQPDAVADGEGNILFRSGRDRPAESTCFDSCAIDWPPVLTNGPPQVTGIDPALVGTIRRPDGTLQVTLGGWPLYRQTGTGTPGVAQPGTPPTSPLPRHDGPGNIHQRTSWQDGREPGQPGPRKSPDSAGQGGC